mgnify:CR=1 FL=1
MVNRGPAKGCVWPVIAPAEGIVRAGAVLRGGCGSRAGLRSFYAGRAFLLGCLVLVRAHHTFLPKCFTLDHACCLPHSAKQNGLRNAPFLFRRVEIAIRAFSRCQCGYLPLLVHFGLVRFFMAIPTENEGTRGTENGVGGAAWVRFCVNVLALPCFPRGVRWGCAPQTAPKSLRLSGLSSFDSRCGCVSRGEGHLGMTET